MRTKEELLKDNITLELGMVEYTTSSNFSSQQVDMFICLSGRGDFKGELTGADRAKFAAVNRNDVTDTDTVDTMRRMRRTTELQQKYFKETGKLVPIFFNGLKVQNEQLREILAAQQHYLGVPARCFIIDEIPLNNTLGQVISLRVFIEKNKHLFNPDGPRLVVVTSSYHEPRVVRTFGADSPLMTSGFFRHNQGVLKQLSSAIKRIVLQDVCFMSKAEVMVFGIDRIMKSRPDAEKDIAAESNAIVNYSTNQNPPSISVDVAPNIMQYRWAMVRSSLQGAIFFERLLKEVKHAEPDSNKAGITLCL